MGVRSRSGIGGSKQFVLDAVASGAWIEVSLKSNPVRYFTGKPLFNRVRSTVTLIDSHAETRYDFHLDEVDDARWAANKDEAYR